MNKYVELTQRHAKEFNHFSMFFAFSNDQFINGKEKLGIKDNKDLLSIAGGGFIRKQDFKKFQDLLTKHKAEEDQAIREDLTGAGYIFDMFKYELSNHEYIYTGDLGDTLECLDITYKQVLEDDRLNYGLQKAIQTLELEEEKRREEEE